MREEREMGREEDGRCRERGGGEGIRGKKEENEKRIREARERRTAKQARRKEENEMS